MNIMTSDRKAVRVAVLSLITTFLIIVAGTGTVLAMDDSALATKSATNGAQTYTYISPVKTAPMAFTGLGIKWKQTLPENTAATVYVQFQTNDGWTEWVKMDGDYELSEGSSEDFVSTNLATAYRYKVELASDSPDLSPVVSNLEFTYVHAKPVETQKAAIYLPQIKMLADTGTVKVASTAGTGFKVISRSGWGADESLRFLGTDKPAGEMIAMDGGAEKETTTSGNLSKTVSTDTGGKTLSWPLAYPEKVSKIIVHHTATTRNLDDPAQAIRNIYYYHSITRGWGDIGYNYILDQKGNIYEGRYGGDGVVGGHAYNYNVGSIGIAVLGNYEENQVPQPVIDSLSNLIKIKSTKYGIDPEGSSTFGGKMLPNVIGHRDVGATACPGKNMYSLLPAVRKMAKGGLISNIIDRRRAVSANMDYNYDLAESISLFQMDANTTKILDIKLKNTGTQNWEASTYLMLGSNGAEQYFTNGTALKSSLAGKIIKPNETASFKFDLKAANQSGFAQLEIFPMINGTKKVEKYIGLPAQVISASLDYEFVGVTYDRQFIAKGQTAIATITLRNTGTTTWKRDGVNRVRIGTENPRDRISRFIQTPGNRLGDMVQSEVLPGGTVEFKVKLKAPAREGVYREYFTPVIEGVSWLENKGTYLEFIVSESTYKAKYLGTGNMDTFLPGEKKQVWMEFMNMGRRSWQKSGSSGFDLDITRSTNLLVTDVDLASETVAPGETVRVNMLVQAPKEEGLYRLLVTPKAGARKLTVRPIVLYVKVDGSAVVKSDWISKDTVTSGTTAPSAVSNDLIRIGIGFKGNPVISANGGFKLYEGAKEKATYSANEKAEVTYSAGKYSVKGPKNTFSLSSPPVFKPVYGTILRIDNYENRPEWKPELNDNEYQGNLEVHYYENRLQVVNELPLEDYLKGLAEISATEHFEKIKAIIVLARSYAKFYMSGNEKFPGAPYHLSDDPERSQKYLGYGFTKRNITGAKAVEATKGVVVTYNGKVIKTPYFSSSDGRTRSAQEVWGWTDTPYLVSVDDPGCAGKTLNGHGVGLSGCGSQYMATQGKTYIEIIKYYFKGVEVKKI